MAKDLKVGDVISNDDGSLIFEVIKITNTDIRYSVINYDNDRWYINREYTVTKDSLKSNYWIKILDA